MSTVPPTQLPPKDTGTSISASLSRVVDEYCLMENHLFSPIEKMVGVGMARAARAFFAIMPMFELLAIACALIPWAAAPFWFKLLLVASSSLIFFFLATFAGLSIQDLEDIIFRSGGMDSFLPGIEVSKLGVWYIAAVTGLWGYLLLYAAGLSAFFMFLSITMPIIWCFVFFAHLDAAHYVGSSGSSTTPCAPEHSGKASLTQDTTLRKPVAPVPSEEATLRARITTLKGTVLRMVKQRQELIEKSFQENQSIKEYFYNRDMSKPKADQTQEVAQNFSRQIRQLQRNHQREEEKMKQQLVDEQKLADQTTYYWIGLYKLTKDGCDFLVEKIQTEINKADNFRWRTQELARRVRELEAEKRVREFEMEKKVRELEMEKEDWVAV